MVTSLRVRIIALLIALLSLLASGLYWWQLSNAGNQLRSATLAQSELRARQLTGAVADQIAILIRYIDFAEQELAASYLSGKPEEFSVHVRRIEQRFPAGSLLQIGIIDARGYLAYSNLGFKGPVNLSDRDHFKAHLGAEKEQLFVSAPIFGRVSKQWAIQFSRPILRQGRFAGVIVFSLSPDYLHKTLAELTLASDDSIAIFRQSGEYLARNREHESVLGKRVGPDREFVGANAPPDGSFTSAANFDKVVRLFRWQRLGDYPVIIVLGLSETTLLKPVEEILSRNRQQAIVATIILWLFTLGAFVLLLRLRTQQKLIVERAEQLRADEARLRAIYEILPVGISLTNREGHTIDCNPAAEKLFGMARAGQLALAPERPQWPLLRPDGSAMPEEEYASVRAMREGVAVRDVEMQLVTPQGNTWLQVSAIPINADQLGVVIAYADITTHKRMEAELRDSEQRFRNLFEKNSSVMLLIDPASGEIVDANTAATDFYGHPTNRLIGMAIGDINALSPERVAEEIQRALSEQRNYFIFAHRLANGNTRTVEVHSTPIAVGKKILLVSIIHDITQRVLDKERADNLMREQKAILDSRIVGIFKAWNRKFIWTNAAFAEMLGYTQEELTGQPTRMIYPDSPAYETFGEAAYPLIRKGEIFRSEVRYQRKNGSLGWYEISGGLIAPLSDESIWAFVDISERKMTEAALQESEAFKLAILNSLPAEIAVIDGDGVILAVNELWRRFSLENGTEPGTPAAHTEVGANYLAACTAGPDTASDGALDARNGILAVLNASLPSYRLEYPCHSQEQQRWFTMTVTPLGLGTRAGAVITHINYTERRLMEEQVRQLAFHDTLTALPNRRLLNDRLKQSLAANKRSGRYGALMFLDLDNFKPLNDSHGHEVGDLLLIEVADRLKTCVREMDTVARFGGDEFVVMISELETGKNDSAAQAAIIAAKIRIAVAAPYRLAIGHEGKTETVIEHHCTASIGVTLFIDHEASPEEIFRRADTAMYAAKEGGRNTIRFHESTA